MTHRADLQSNCEDLIVTIKHKRNNKIIHIIGVYLPTEARMNDISNFTENFTRMRESLADGCFVLCGDFNIPSQTRSHAQLLNELFSFCDLEQFNEVRNEFNGAVLDLVLSNKLMKVSPAIDQLLKTDIYHPPIVITTPFEGCCAKNKSTLRNFKRINWKGLNEDLMKIHWEEIFANSSNVNDKVELFYGKLFETLDDHCPVLSLRNRNHPKWFSKETVLLLKKKSAIHRNWKKHNNPRDGFEFKIIRRSLKKQMKEDYENFIAETETNLQENPSDFWKFVKSRRTNGSFSLHSVCLDKKTAENSLDLANLFAEYFGSLYLTSDEIKTNTMNKPEVLQPTTVNFQELSISLSKYTKCCHN